MGAESTRKVSHQSQLSGVPKKGDYDAQRLLDYKLMDKDTLKVTSPDIGRKRRDRMSDEDR